MNTNQCNRNILLTVFFEVLGWLGVSVSAEPSCKDGLTMV